MYRGKDGGGQVLKVEQAKEKSSKWSEPGEGERILEAKNSRREPRDMMTSLPVPRSRNWVAVSE